MGHPMVKQHINMEAEIIIRQFLRIFPSEKPRCERMENRAEPTMMQTMKQEKTICIIYLYTISISTLYDTRGGLIDPELY